MSRHDATDRNAFQARRVRFTGRRSPQARRRGAPSLCRCRALAPASGRSPPPPPSPSPCPLALREGRRHYRSDDHDQEPQQGPPEGQARGGAEAEDAVVVVLPQGVGEEEGQGRGRAEEPQAEQDLRAHERVEQQPGQHPGPEEGGGEAGGRAWEELERRGGGGGAGRGRNWSGGGGRAGGPGGIGAEEGGGRGAREELERRRGEGGGPGRNWSGGGGGGWHKASVSDCSPLAAPIGLSPPLILTLCGPKRVLVVSTEPPDDLSCWTTPVVGRPGDELLPMPLTRGIQMHTPSPCGGLPTPALTCARRCVCLQDHFPDRGF